MLVFVESEDEYPSIDLNDPEKLLINGQEREKFKQNIIEQFVDCPNSLAYINQRLNGSSKSEIMREIKINSTEFETIRRKVMRRLKKTGGKNQYDKTGSKKPN